MKIFRKIRQNLISDGKTVRFLLNSVRIENEDLLFKYEFQKYFTLTSDIMREQDEIYNRTLDEINTIPGLIDKELVESG